VLIGALIAVLAAACVGAGSPGQGAPTPGSPAASDAPGGGTGGGTSGGTSGNPGGGVVTSDPGAGVPVGPAPVDPGANQPHLEIPKPGHQNPHPVAVQSLQASVDGRHVLVKLTWYGGIAPCSVLDSVQVDRADGTIALTVIEGSSDPTAICPEIAMLKATIADLGELAPGPWTISATNSEVAPIQLTIS
jgi:hypothetical protein